MCGVIFLLLACAAADTPAVAQQERLERSRLLIRSTAGLPTCGPKGSDCCIGPQQGPGCDDPACVSFICAADPFCCEVLWDGLCGEQACALCEVCFPLCESGSNCCEPHDTPGCNIPGCQEQVCAADPFCCRKVWDNLCAQAAQHLCHCGDTPCPTGACCLGIHCLQLAEAHCINAGGSYLGDDADCDCPCPADLNGDGAVNASDLALLLGGWGLGGVRDGDLTVDGMIDAADLAVVLGQWGSCE